VVQCVQDKRSTVLALSRTLCAGSAGAAAFAAGSAADPEPDVTSGHLEQAHLNGAHLERADLSGAHLEGANLSGVHLEGAVGLEQDQIANVRGDAETILPQGITRPADWPSGYGQ
jgi:uncharacterized protein YjbI with pentapeptide repeats